MSVVIEDVAASVALDVASCSGCGYAHRPLLFEHVEFARYEAVCPTTGTRFALVEDTRLVPPEDVGAEREGGC